ncbi:laminin G domain-containing protein [Paractinoplanes hotanensis]|uniref:Laminin G domain-containing protein n=1 Tax=Paractinoplanes hotanensis TaxID=2906497 RepID=A0ABT0Y7E2_9ACTN|nr:laminin G domain-containing protein [Actinoplanes hotanensis]MCM4081750.1 laminin G domain-containing protein [Actinoplanes hotanensis]
MSRKRWWAASIGALVLVGLAVHAQRPSSPPAFAVGRPAVSPQPAPPDLATRTQRGAGALAGLLPIQQPDASPPPGRIRTASGPVTVRYTFDGGVGRPITDHLGRHELRPLGQNGGALRLVRQGSGLALSYPDRCRLAHERDCPRAILEGRRDDTLNPGTKRLQYGAAVRMSPADLSEGANVVQKGYSVGRVSQYKLQVDHRLGHPSCVLAGDGAIYRAEPTVNVADGRWHKLECTRARSKLTLTIDDAPAATVAVPPSLSIANAEPLRVGGKGTGKSNDQFAGEIDNVFIQIS